MRRVHTRSIKPGSILGKSIKNADGTTILGEGVRLTPHYIKRLMELGITVVYVWDERTADVEFTEPIKEETRQRAAKKVRQVIHNSQTNLRHKALSNGFPGLKKVVDDILNDLLVSGKLIMEFSEIKSRDDYTFFHSVNVCILALFLGMRYGLTENQLRELGLGALLHDIGKNLVPKELLIKPGRLTPAEWDLMKKHPTYGFEILRRNIDITIPAAHVAFQHHERWDGKGYPRRLQGQEIHLYARMTAICDVYDALTSDRVYRHRYLPNEAMEYILGNGQIHFDLDLIRHFTNCVALYPLGSQVRLSNGRLGVVIKISQQATKRPVIRVLEDETGRELPRPYDLDLTRCTDITVTQVLE